jgi:CRISPR-associated protein Csd2
MGFLKNPGPTNVGHRCEAIFLFSAENCNPNGDPDNDSRPRQDPETGHGLVTNVCIKRHFRDTLPHIANGNPGYKIYIQSKAVLDHTLEDAYKSLGMTPGPKATKQAKEEQKKARGEAKKTAVEEGEPAPEEAPRREIPEQTAKAAAKMCADFYDVRTFGAVMASKVANCGQVRGPIQISMARSIDPVVVVEDSITRIAIQTDREAEANFMNQTFGAKHRVPFGLYAGHIFYTPSFAEKTGFKEEDFRIFWETMARLFEYTRSSGRDDISMEQIIVFEHESRLGNAHSHRLFEMVAGPGEDGKPRLRRRDETKPPRAYTDYIIPTQAEVESRVEAAGIRGVKVHYLL